jgi:signal transduction histidine kinase
MPDFVAAALPRGDTPFAGLVEALLNVSPVGTLLVRPLYAAGATTIIDFAWEQLNPAAQVQLQLPKHPATSFLVLFPTTQQSGVFRFCCEAFESGRLAQHSTPQQLNGLAGACLLTAQRHAHLLVISILDTQSALGADRVLQECQAREQQIRTEANELQVQLLNEELAAFNEELTASNEELAVANFRLTRTNTDLENFIYTASHDLRQPISNIEGLLGLLQELLPQAAHQDNQIAPILHQMHTSVERFTRTIAHLTEISKLQVEYDQSPALVWLKNVFEDVRQDLLPQILKEEAQLEVALHLCRTHMFSEKNLRSILYNLLSNALKYRHPDRPPHVRITCTQQQNHLFLSVQDNGLGLHEWQQARLFQLFQRLHTHVEGSGVGLYMVKRIMDNAGGTITVQSQVGVGTKFTLSFLA